jgi:mRNA-degrading endonuclease RelE of RelBE toxin-antitoxin system
MRARDRAIVLTGIREQLSFEPLRETKNRTPMDASQRVVALGITWELRIAGSWRVFYSVDDDVITVDVIDIARKGREMTDQILASADDDDEEENR